MNRLSLKSKNMKFNKVIKLSAVAVLLSLSVVGCKKGLGTTTPLPGRGVSEVPTPPPSGLIGDNNKTTPTPPIDNTAGVKPPESTTTPIPIPTPVVPTQPPVVNPEGTSLNKDLPSWKVSADQPFKSETVYFDFDKSTVKPGEVTKIERVASGIKGLAGKGLRIEGHCDERGTEEYNRSLGERRALAVREALMRAGVDSNLIDTISYGEDRPVDPGHNEAAWSKNRRGEFIVIEPPGPVTGK